MSAFLAISRKSLAESRWLLGLTAFALFWLSWLFVYRTYQYEAVKGKPSDDIRVQMRQRSFPRFAQGIGGPAVDGSSAALSVAFWRFPFILLFLCPWPIARGSAAVAGEIERGSLDLVLSRPVSRTAYLAAQASAALVGLAVLTAALAAGNWGASRHFPLETPATPAALARGAANAFALGLAIYGYALALSAVDVVRWRANLAASALTMIGYLCQLLAGFFADIPSLERLKYLDRLSIFKGYDPVEAVISGRNLPFNAAILVGVGLAGLAIAALAFARRDLPANG